MIDLKIERFGGEISSEDNSINLSVVINLSTMIDEIELSKRQDLRISTEETEIYDLVYQLQPLVYEYCKKALNLD